MYKGVFETAKEAQVCLWTSSLDKALGLCLAGQGHIMPGNLLACFNGGSKWHRRWSGAASSEPSSNTIC